MALSAAACYKYSNVFEYVFLTPPSEQDQSLRLKRLKERDHHLARLLTVLGIPTEEVAQEGRQMLEGPTSHYSVAPIPSDAPDTLRRQFLDEVSTWDMDV